MPRRIILSISFAGFPEWCKPLEGAHNEKYKGANTKILSAQWRGQSLAATHSHFAPLSAIRQPHV
jgi:hypothetical protein